MARSWWKKLFPGDSPKQPAKRPAAKLDLLPLEDRSVPAAVTVSGTAVSIDLAANEELSLRALSATDIRFDLVGGVFTGDATGPTFTLGGSTSVSITDAAGGTSVAFANSGLNSYAADVSVTLDSGSAGVSFDSGGKTTFAGAKALTVTADDTITVDSGATIRSATGGISLTATGATSDVILDHGQADGVYSAGAAVTINAGRDALLGATTTGDVRGLSVSTTAGRDIIIDALTFVRSDGSGGNTAVAGRNISILQTKAPDSRLDASGGGAVSVRTGAAGAGGTFTLDTGSTNGIGTGSGSITVVSDSVALTSGKIGTSGTVTIRTASAPTTINLGGADAAGVLGLTNAELGLVEAGTLQIGIGIGGGITVTDAITLAPAKVARLDLITGAAVTDGRAAVGADITASKLNIVAGTGVGTLANPLETDVDNLEGTTTTGDVAFANDGAVTIGGGNGVIDINTVAVNAAAGAVLITASGDITVSEDVVGPSGVTLTASGAGADIFVQAGVNSVISTSGAVLLDADGDVTVGTSAAEGRVNGKSTTVLADGNVLIQNGSVVQSDGAGGTTVTAGGNVTISNAINIGARINANASGAPVAVTTGAAGTFTLDSGSATDGVGGNGGTVTITADKIALTSGSIGNTGVVALRPVGTGVAIDLGTAADTGFGLSDAELDRITAGTLRVGDAANTGGIAISGAISIAPAKSATLSLVTGAGVATAGGKLTATNLRVSAAGAVSLTGANDVDDLAVAAAGQAVSFTDSDGVAIGAADGVNGVTAADFTLTTNGAVTQTQAVVVTGTTTLAPGAGNSVTLANASNNFGTLAISNGLDATIRDSAGGLIFGTTAITGTLQADVNGGAATQTGTITAAALGVRAKTGIALGLANDVDTLALDNTLGGGSSGAVSFRDTDGFTVGTVTNIPATVSQSGISNPGRAVTLTNDAGTVAQAAGKTISGGALTLSGGSTFTLTEANTVAALATSGTAPTAISLTDAAGLDLAGVTTANLTLTNTGTGNITQSAPVAVTGTTTIAAGAANNITLTDAINNFGTVAATSGKNLSLVDANAVTVGGTLAGDLTVNAADVTLSAATAGGVIGATGTTSVTVAGTVGSTGATTLSAPTVNLNADVSAGAALTVTGAAVLGASVTLGGTSIGLGGVTGGGNSLTLNSGGTTTLAGASGLLNLTTNAAGSTQLNGGVSASGDVTFGDSVSAPPLGSATITAANIALNGGAGGSGSLTLNSSGQTTIGGTVNIIGNNSLTTDAAGTTLVNATSIAVNTLDLQDNVTLGENLTVNGVTATFAGTLAGGTKSLAINGSGTTTFGGAATNLSAFTSDAGGTTAVNGGALAASGAVIVGDTLSLGNNATITGGSIALNAVTGNSKTLTLNASAGTTTLNAAPSNLAALTTDAGGGTTLNANSLSASGLVNIGDTLTLTANTAISGGTITLAAVTGATNSLALNSAGVTTIGGAVSNVASLTTDATGSTNLNASVTATGAVTFNDAVSLGATATVAGTSVTFNEAVTQSATSDLTVNSGGATTFAKSVSVNALTTNAGGTTSLGGNVTTAGNATFNDAVSLAANVVIDAGAGNITLASLDGNTFSATLNSSGTTSLPTGATDINNLTTNATGTTLLGGDVTATGAVSFGDTLSLASNVVVDAASASFADVTGNIRTLAVLSPGVTTFGGSATGLASLSTDAPGSTVVTGAALSATTVALADPVTAGNLVLSADELTIGAAFDPSGAGKSLTIQPVTGGRPVLVGGNSGSKLSLSVAEIDAINNFATLTIGSSAAGTLTVASNVTSPAATTNLIAGASADVAVTGGSIVTADDLNVSAGTTIGSNGGPFRFQADELTTSSGGDQFLSTVGSVDVGAADLASSGGTVRLVAGSYFTAPGNNINAPVEVRSGATLAGTGTTGNVSVANGGVIAPGFSPGIINTGDLTLTSGSTFNAEVNGPTAGVGYDQVNVTGSVTLGGATLSLTGAITSSGGSPIVLINNDSSDPVSGIFAGLPQGAPVTVGSVQFSISYTGGVNGNDVVLIEADATVAVVGNDVVVTGRAAADAISVASDTANSEFVITITGASIATGIAGASGGGTSTVRVPFAAVGTGGSLVVNGLAGADTLTVDFGSGAFSKGVVFNGGADPDTLVLTGGSTFDTVTHTYVDNTSGSVAVTGNALVSYAGLEPITDNLSATNRVFDYTGGTETITVTDTGGADGKSTIDSTLGESTEFTNPTQTLLIRTTNGTGTDAVTIDGLDAGYKAALTVLGHTGAAGDTVTLNAALNLGTGNTGNLAITAKSINVNAGISTTAGSVGNVTFTNNGGALTLDTPGITAGGLLSQTTSGPVVLAGNASLESANSNVEIAGPVDGASAGKSLSVTASASVTLGSSVGATTPLDGLTVNATEGITLGGALLKTSGAQTYNDGVDLTAAAVEFTSTGGGNVAFNGPVEGSGVGNADAVVNTAGTTSFAADVNLKSLTTDAAGTTAFNDVGNDGITITTSLAQTFNDAVTVSGSDVTFAPGAALTFAQTLDGGANVAVETTSAVNFQGVVGGTGKPLTLTVDNGAGGNTGAAINVSANVSTGNALTLRGGVTLLGDATFESVNDAAVLLASLDGGFSATVNTAGTTTLGNVGAATPVASLATDAGGTTVLTGGTVTASGAAGVVFGDAVDATGAANPLTITADKLDFGSGINGAATKSLSIRPFSLGTNILVGDDGAAELSVEPIEITGFQTVSIGRDDGTGTVTVQPGAISVSNKYTLRAGGAGGKVVVQGGAGNSTLTLAGGTYNLNAVAVAYNAPNFEFDGGAGDDALIVDLSVAGTTAAAVTLSGGADNDALQVIGRNGLTATAGAAGVAVSGGPALALTGTEFVDLVDFDSLTYTGSAGADAIAVTNNVTAVGAADALRVTLAGVPTTNARNVDSVSVNGGGGTDVIDFGGDYTGTGVEDVTLSVAAGQINLSPFTLPAADGDFSATAPNMFVAAGTYATGDDQTFAGQFNLNADATIQAGTGADGDVTFAGLVTGNAGADLTVNVGGTLLVDNDVNWTGKLTVGATGNTVLDPAGTINARDGIQFGNPVTVTRTGPVSISASVNAVEFLSTLNAGSSNLVVTADAVTFGNDAADLVTGTGTLTLQPDSTTKSVTVGGVAPPEFAIDQAELDRIQSTFSTVFIGRSDSTASFTLNAGTVFPEAPTVTVLRTGPASAFIYEGTADDETVRLFVDAGVTYIERTVGGVTENKVAVVGGSFTFNGNGGDDTFVVELAGGLSAFGTITFDGGAGGNDLLRLIGDAAKSFSANSTASGAGAGSIAYGLTGTLNKTLNFTGLEPVDYVDLANVTIAGLAGADAILVENGVLDGDATKAALVVREAGAAFEEARIRNVTNLVIDGDLGADTVSVNAPTDNHLVTNVTINAESVSLDDVTLTGDLTVNADATAVVDGAAVTTTGGAVVVNGGTLALGNAAISANGGFAQNGGGAVTLTNGLATVQSNFGGINFSGAIDSEAGETNALSLTATNGVNVLDVITLAQSVGATVRLSSFGAAAGERIQINGATVRTTGAQTYTGPTALGAAATLFDADANGDVTFAGTLNGASDVDVNTAGVTAFGGAVGGTTPLLSLETNAGGSVLLGGDVTTVNAQSYGENATLTGNATFTSNANAAVSFGGTLDGAFNATVNTTGATTFTGAVGGAAKLASLTTNAGGTTAVNGGGVATTGVQSYGDAVTVGAATTFAANDAITFGSTLNGAFAVAVNTPGATTFTGAVGGATPLASLSTDAGGTTAVNGGAVTTTGDQTFGDNVTVGAATTFEATGAGNVAFGGTLNGAFAVAVETDNAVTFGSTVGNSAPLASLTVDGSSAAKAAVANFTGNVTTTGAQTYDATASVLKATSTFASTGGGAVNFTGTLDSDPATGFGATVNTTGATTFGADVGATGRLASLTTNAGGTTTVGGTQVLTDGAQSFGDAVTLTQATTLFDSDTAGVAFGSTLDGASAVTVNAPGTTSFNGQVGGTTALTSLTTDAAGTTGVGGGLVRTTGAQTFNDPVGVTGSADFTSSGGGDVTFASTLDGGTAVAVNTAGVTTFGGEVGSTTPVGSLTTDAAGSTRVAGPVVLTSGAQTFNDDVTLTGDATFSSLGNAQIAFQDTLDGGFNATVRTIGLTLFAADVGSITPLASLTTTSLSGAGPFGPTKFDGALVATTGNQVYDDGVLVSNAAIEFRATGANSGVAFNGTLAGNADSVSAVTVNAPGVTRFGGDVGAANALLSLTTDAAGRTQVDAGQVITNQAQQYNDAVNVSGSTGFTSQTTDITFGATLDGPGSAFVIAPGQTRFGADVGGTTPLGQLFTDPAGTTLIQGAQVKTTGNQQFLDAVTVQQDTVFTASAGSVQFGSTLNGTNADADAVTIRAAAGATLNDEVGNATRLESLTVEGVTAGTPTASIALGAAANPITLNTAQAQTYRGPTTINDAATFVTPTDVTFDGTLGGNNTATVNADGVTTFGAAVNVRSLVTNAAGSTKVATNVTTTNAMTFNDDVTLTGDATFASTAAGAVSFNDTLDGTFNAAVNTGGVTTFNGNIGTTARLASLSTNAAGTTTINGAQVLTVGQQTFGDPVTLTNATTLFDSDNGGVAFGGTLDGASAVTVDSPGATSFGGQVGGTTALTSLTTSGGGTTDVNGGLVRTTGGQTFNDSVTAGADAAFTSTGAGDVLFNATLDGAANVAVNTAGLTKFSGDVGGTTPLTSLTTDAAGTLTVSGSRVLTTGNQTYGDPITLTADDGTTATDTTLRASGAGATIDVNQGVTGANTDLVICADFINIDGDVTTKSLTFGCTGETPTVQLCDDVTVAGDLLYRGDLLLCGDVTLTSTGGGSITIEGRVDLAPGEASGDNGLTVITTGATAFRNSVGTGAVPGSVGVLEYLRTNAGGTTEFGRTGSGPFAVVTKLDQTYNDAASLKSEMTFTADDGVAANNLDTIVFGSTLDGPRGATVNTSAETRFVGSVGATTALASLTTDAAGTTRIDGAAVRTVANQTFNDPVSVSAANVTFTGTNVTFTQTLDGAAAGVSNVTVNASSTTTFTGNVGGTNKLASLTTDGPGNTQVGGNVSTTGDQTYGDSVNANGAANAFAAATGNITFDSPLFGGSDVTVDTDGAATFRSGVTLKSLSVDADAGIAFGNSAGAVQVQTINNQFYDDAVTLKADLTFASSANGAITFDDTLNSDVAGVNGAILNTTGATTFNGDVGGANRLEFLTTDAGGTTTFGAAVGTVGTTGVQTYGDAVTVSKAGTITLSSTTAGVTFNNTLNAAAANTTDVVVSSPAVTAFNGTVGATTRLRTLTTDAAGATAFGPAATQVLTNGTQTYNDGVSAAVANILFDADANDVLFQSTLNGPAAVTVDAPGITRFQGAVGGTTPLAALTVVGGGTTQVNGGLVQTTGGQSYGEPVTVGAPGAAGLTTFRSTAAGNVNFTATLDSAPATSAAVRVETAGTTTFNGTVGGTTKLASLATDGPGATAVNGDVFTTGDQTFGDSVALDGATTTFGAAAGTIRFDSPLFGPSDVTVNTDGSAEFRANVTVNSLTVDADAGIRFGNAAGAVTVATVGKQLYDDAATLKADVAFTSSGAGAVTFNSTLDSAPAGANGATVGTAGLTTFNGDVGAAGRLEFLTTADGGTTKFGPAVGRVLTTGQQNFGDAVTVSKAGALQFGATAGGVRFSNTLDGTADGATAVSVLAPAGATEFLGDVGAAGTRLRSLTTDAGGGTSFGPNAANVLTSGAQTYGDAVTVNRTAGVGVDILFQSEAPGGVITFDSTLTGPNSEVVICSTVGVTLEENVNVASLVVGCVGTAPVTMICGDVVTTGSQFYRGDVVLCDDVLFRTTAGGAVTFNGRLDSDLTLPDGAYGAVVDAAGLTTFQGAVGGRKALARLITTGGGTTAVNGGAVRTLRTGAGLDSGEQTYNDAVTVGAGTLFLAAGNAEARFNGTLDGPFAVNVEAGGLTRFGGAVGGAAPLASLLTNGGGANAVAGGLVQTTGAQQYFDSVDAANAANATTFRSLNSGAVAFFGDLDAASTAVAVSTAGTTVFGDSNADRVGGAAAPATVVFDGAGAININAGLFQTGGAQTFPEPVSLGAGSLLVNAGGDVAFLSTVDGPANLTVRTGGVTTFAGRVGGNSALQTLTTDGGGATVVRGGLVQSLGDQKYLDAVIADPAGVDPLLFNSPFGEVSFAATLDGARNVVVTAGNRATFGGAVGSAAPLTTLTVAAPAVTVAGGLVQTVGDQTITGDVTTTGPASTRFTTGGGAVRVNGSLATDGARGVVVATGTGDVAVSGNLTVGGSLEVERANNVSVGGATSTGSLLLTSVNDATFNGPVTSQGDIRAVAARDVTFVASATAAGTFLLEAARDLRVGGDLAANFVELRSVNDFAVGGNLTAPAGVLVGFANNGSVGGTTRVDAGGLTVNRANDLTFGPLLIGRGVDLADVNDVRVVGSTTVADQLLVRDGGNLVFGDVTANSVRVDRSGNATFGPLTATNGATFGVTDDITVGGPLVSGNGPLGITQARDLLFGSVRATNVDIGTIRNGSLGPVTAPGGVRVGSANDITFNGGVDAGGSAIRQATGTGTTRFNGGLVTATGGFDLENGSIVLDGGARLNAGDSDLRFAPRGGGVFSPNGSFTGRDLQLNGSGTFELNNAGNDVNGVFRAATGGGSILLRVADDLTVDGQQGIQAPGNLTIYAGGAFRLVDEREARYATPLVNIGGGSLLVVGALRPLGDREETNLVTSETVEFRSDAVIAAANIQYGNRGGTGPDERGQRLSNVLRENFFIRATPGVTMDVFGNDPNVAPGDQFTPIRTNVGNLRLSGVNSRGVGSGDYVFSFAGAADGLVRYNEIESLGSLGFRGAVVQTGDRAYSVRYQAIQVAGASISRNVSGAGLQINPFVVAPSLRDSTSTFNNPQIAFADVNGDQTADLIVASGSDDVPLVTVIDGRELFNGTDLLRLDTLKPSQLLAQFFAFETTFRGGVNLSAGDFNGDGRAEIVVGARQGGSARVSIYSVSSDPTLNFTDRARLANSLDGTNAFFRATGSNFFAFAADDPNFRGGVNVAVGDVDGDGTPDLILGAGVGGGPRVRILSGFDGRVLNDYFAYESSFRGGVFVAAGDFDGGLNALQRPTDEVVTAPGLGGGPRVVIWSNAGERDRQVALASFFAFDMQEQASLSVAGGTSMAAAGVGGVSFGTRNSAGTLDVLVSTPRGPRLQVKRFSLSPADGKVETFDFLAELTAPNPQTPGVDLGLKDPVTGAPLDPNQLRDGASVAGSSFGSNT